jgi:hypothetical protein
MNLQQKTGEDVIKDKLQEYVDMKNQFNRLKAELDERKAELDELISDDTLSIENVGVFKRKAGFFRKNFDKTKAMEYLSDEQVAECVNETEVKGAVEIVSWETFTMRKNMMGEKE